MEGTVKFYNSSKGFGFIEVSEGKDVFVGENNLNGLVLEDGDKVTFDTEDTDRGKSAINVVKVE